MSQLADSVGERLGGDGGIEDVGREEVEAEGEVRAREHGEGFDEDIGDGFFPGKVRVELVAVQEVAVSVCCQVPDEAG